jgi:transcriptional regulator with XRE-family HTH domain
MPELPRRQEPGHPTEAPNRAVPTIAARAANPEAAQRLRQAVRAAGGNKAVAFRSGVPLATINNYVRGRNGMKIEPLAALAAACQVSLEWLVSGMAAPATAATATAADPAASTAYPAASTAATASTAAAASAAYPAADPPGSAAPPPGLGEAPADTWPSRPASGVDLRVLTKAIETVTAIAGAASFRDDPKGLARRIATIYAVLIEPEASRD